MKINNKQVLFSAVAILLVVGFLEMTLALLAFMSPRVEILLKSPWAPIDIPDAYLGNRPNPAYPEHDSKGFRNPKMPARVQLVALGDSQTYGTGVGPEKAWPRVVETMTGKKVYGMAHGGYGPTHSLVLMNEAFSLSPEIIIEAFYAGNDLYDSFNHVYNLGQLPELKSSDPELQAAVRDAEKFEPIATRVDRMFHMGAISDVDQGEAKPDDRDSTSLRRFFSEKLKIYGLLRRTWYELAHSDEKSYSSPQEEWENTKAVAETCPEFCQLFKNGQFKTAFTSEYRLSALDLKDPRIFEGLQVSLRAILRMKALAAERNIRFVVVLIPTKETVFHQLLQNPSKSYRSLTDNEAQFWMVTKKFFEDNAIEYLDSLPELQAQLAAGFQPYRASADGHPNELGHYAIARRVASYIQ